MKVVIISASPGRGAAEKLTRVLTEHGKCDVRTFVKGFFFDKHNRMFFPPYYNISDKRALDEALDWCDVAHCMHLSGLRSPEISRPDILDTKRVIYHRFTIVPDGQVLRSLWQPSDFERMTVIYCAAGWGRFVQKNDPKHVLIRDTFMVDDPVFDPVPIAERQRRAYYCTLKRGDPKKREGIHRGYKDMLKVLHGTPTDSDFGMLFHKSMRRRKTHWVGVDELFTPILHLTPYEYAACGVPCITNWDEQTEREFHSGISTGPVPFILSDIGKIRFTIDDVLSWPDDRMFAESQRLRVWMRETMHPDVVAQQYLKLYQSSPEVDQVAP